MTRTTSIVYLQNHSTSRSFSNFYYIKSGSSAASTMSSWNLGGAVEPATYSFEHKNCKRENGP